MPSETLHVHFLQVAIIGRTLRWRDGSFDLPPRHAPPSWIYVGVSLTLVLLFEILPYLEELCAPCALIAAHSLPREGKRGAASGGSLSPGHKQDQRSAHSVEFGHLLNRRQPPIDWSDASPECAAAILTTCAPCPQADSPPAGRLHRSPPILVPLRFAAPCGPYWPPI